MNSLYEYTRAPVEAREFIARLQQLHITFLCFNKDNIKNETKKEIEKQLTILLHWAL